MLLTSKQYNWLVKNRASWMQSVWPCFKKHWLIGGVRVTADFQLCENLQNQLQEFPNE